MKKKIGLAVIFLAFVGTLLYLYAYKDHRNIATEKSDFEITVLKLRTEFLENDSIANNKYQDKTIEVVGEITSVDRETKGIVLDQKLYGTFNEALPDDLVVGKLVKIKGRFIGFDDLLEEFKLDQITLVK